MLSYKNEIESIVSSDLSKTFSAPLTTAKIISQNDFKICLLQLKINNSYRAFDESLQTLERENLTFKNLIVP